MRNQLLIKVGSYTGDGNDNRDIEVGFRPDLVIIKGGNRHSVWRNRWMQGDSTANIGDSAANFANAIQAFLYDGFQVGSNNTVNESAVVYHYIAIRGVIGQNYFRVGRYTGDGNDDRSLSALGLLFTPDFLMIKRDGASTARWKTSDATLGGNSLPFSGSSQSGNIIQSIIENGFQVGTDNTVNASGERYFFAALKELAGAIKVGRYTGDGQDGRHITGVGFQPDAVLVKVAEETYTSRLRTSEEAGDETLNFGTTGSPNSDEIQELEEDGFELGTATSVNENGKTYYYLALKTGNHEIQLDRETV